MIKLEPERIGKMTDAELEQALSALASEPLHPLDAIDLRKLIDAELHRRWHARNSYDYFENQTQRLAAIAALSDDELKERLKLKPDDSDLIQEFNKRAGKRRRALVKQLRPQFAAMTNEQLIEFATGPFEDTVRKIDVTAALSELSSRITKVAAGRLSPAPSPGLSRGRDKAFARE
jgi:hypothetical protein